VISEASAAQICITAQSLGITPIVRIPSHDGYYANRILDAGAMGVVAPHVNSADEARAIVKACKFAPSASGRSQATGRSLVFSPTLPTRCAGCSTRRPP
jgi:2-keto-3-deoxy-L-rhamnonate aldolase RhmA